MGWGKVLPTHGLPVLMPNAPRGILRGNVFTISLSFSQFTKELEPDILSMVYLNDRCECYSKRYSCLTKNYHHTQVCDNYYTKLYITS